MVDLQSKLACLKMSAKPCLVEAHNVEMPRRPRLWSWYAAVSISLLGRDQAPPANRSSCGTDPQQEPLSLACSLRVSLQSTRSLTRSHAHVCAAWGSLHFGASFEGSGSKECSRSKDSSDSQAQTAVTNGPRTRARSAIAPPASTLASLLRRLVQYSAAARSLALVAPDPRTSPFVKLWSLPHRPQLLCSPCDDSLDTGTRDHAEGIFTCTDHRCWI